MNDVDRMKNDRVTNAVSEGLSKALQEATADAKIGTVLIKKLVINVNMVSGGGAKLAVNQYTYKQVIG